MAIEVDLPDGSVAEFPDGTPNDVIKGALQKRFSPPATGQPPGVPEYVPPGVKGYDPKTGEVAPQYTRSGSAGMGAADAVTFGFGDELGSYLGSAISGVPRDQVLAEMRDRAKAAQKQNPGSYLAGQVGGGLAQGVATGGAGFGSSVARSGGTLFKTALGAAADGGLAGSIYGAGSADGDLADRVKGAGTGLVTGAVAGGLAPYVAAGASSLVRRAISPFATSAERLAAARVLEQEGIPLTAGQTTGSKALRFAESELGGTAAENVMAQQGEAFTDAAMRRAGGSGRATSDNMADLADKLGQGFDTIASRNSVKLDQGILSDMQKASADYVQVLPPEQKKIFGLLGNEIVKKFGAGQGTISGSDYQVIRSRLSRMSNSYRQRDPEFSSAIRGLRDALDNGMDRSVNPTDAGAWAELRRRYGNMKTLEKAIAGAGGEDAAMGIISPARLRMAASSGNRGAYARGQGDFAELAKAGQAVMSPLPNSGTAGRLKAQNLGAMAPMIGGAAIGGGAGAIPGALLGAAVGAITPKVAGKILMSKSFQQYLANQAAAGRSAVGDAMVAALMRSGAIPAIEGR